MSFCWIDVSHWGGTCCRRRARLSAGRSVWNVHPQGPAVYHAKKFVDGLLSRSQPEFHMAFLWKTNLNKFVWEIKNTTFTIRNSAKSQQADTIYYKDIRERMKDKNWLAADFLTIHILYINTTQERRCTPWYKERAPTQKYHVGPRHTPNHLALKL